MLFIKSEVMVAVITGHVINIKLGIKPTYFIFYQ